MDAFQQPLMRVAQAAQWLHIAPEVRLVHVVTSGSLRLAVLEQLAASEHSRHNTTPYVVLEAPVEADDDGWSLRAAELYDDWEKLRALYAAADPPVTLPPVPEDVGAPGLTGFGARLRAMLDALPAPYTGLTVILAPVWNRDPATWLEDLSATLEQSALRRARFVVVDLQEDHLAPLCERLGAAAERVDARVDTAAAQEQVRQMMRAMASAPPGATGARLVGMAGPAVAPPPRWNAPPEQAPEDLGRVYFDAQLPSGLSDQPRVQELKARLLQAGEAAQRQDFRAAAGAQQAARDLAVDLGLDRESVVFQIMLGSYLLQGGEAEPAEQAYAKASEIALANYHPDLAVQAKLAIGAAQLVARRTAEAAVSYTIAGNLAVDCGEGALAIEAFRVAGQIHASDGRPDDAAAAWRAAVGHAAAAEASQRKASSALEAAEALAALCRERGLIEQADSMDLHVAMLRAELEGDGEAG